MLEHFPLFIQITFRKRGWLGAFIYEYALVVDLKQLGFPRTKANAKKYIMTHLYNLQKNLLPSAMLYVIGVDHTQNGLVCCFLIFLMINSRCIKMCSLGGEYSSVH